MYANTLTLTIDGVAKTLLRRNQDNYGSEYSFKDSVEKIIMKIRHSTETQGGFSVNRHNVFVERTVYATPTASESYWSTTVTLRDREGSDPAELLNTWIGVSTLVLSLDDTLVVGDN